MQRQAWRQIETAGSFIWILVDIDDPNRPLPFALHAIEPDLLSPVPVEPILEGNTFALGIERDRYAKPVRYHFDETSSRQMSSPLGGSLLPGSGGLHLGAAKSGTTTGKMVLAADRVIHGYRILRPSQSTGEPGLAPILNTLHQERRLVEAELTAALNGAACSVAIVSKGGAARGLSDGSTGTDGNGNSEFRLEPGTVFTLDEGESTEVIQNNRPSQAIAPFRLMLCGDEAGATGVPQRMINRDVSRANYSSMRADQLDTKRIIDPETAWFGRLVAREVYQRAYAQLAVLANVYIPPRRSLAYRIATACEVQTDGWAYVDPQKDVAGAIAAVRAGLSTFRDERSSRGKDARDLQKRLEKELTNPLLAQIFNDQATTAAPVPAVPSTDPAVADQAPAPEVV
jgi:capsid protein